MSSESVSGIRSRLRRVNSSFGFVSGGRLVPDDIDPFGKGGVDVDGRLPSASLLAEPLDDRVVCLGDVVEVDVVVRCARRPESRPLQDTSLAAVPIGSRR